MSSFDIIINIIEAFCYCLFIFLVLDKNKKFQYLFLFIFIFFINMSIFNYYLFPEILLTITNFLILFIYSHYLNKNESIQNLFLVLFISVINDISASIAMIVTITFFQFPFYDGNAYILLVLLSKSIFFTLILICSKYVKTYHISKTKILHYCLFALITLNIIYSSLSDFIFYNNMFDRYIFTICICINLLSFFICIIFLESRKEEENKLTMQRNILELKYQENIYQENQKSIQELNKWKHDIKHIFNTIRYNINNNGIDEAKHIIDKYNNILDINHLSVQSGNELLDYILLTKIESIKEQGIHLTIINNINRIPIDNSHLSIMIGNLLDNAIENIGKDKEIMIDVGNVSSYLYIKVMNSIDKPVLKDNPYLLTTKNNTNNHGIGLNSIYLILDKYNGKISFSDDTYFTVKIIIPMSLTNY